MTSPRGVGSFLSRLRPGIGWILASLIALIVLAAWLADLNLPLGDSDDGRLLARFGMAARNFWELGPLESGFGARIDPYIREEYGIEPGMMAPEETLTYAHHPPLQVFITILSVGVLGDNLAALRIVGFLLGAATVLFMAAIGRLVGMAWGPILVALGAMAATGFFFVYGRIGVGYSLVAASVAMVAYLRQASSPPAWVLGIGAVLSCLTAMQSWIGIAATGLALVWLFTAKGMSRPTGWMAVGALVGVVISAGWILINTPTSELTTQVTVQAGTANHPLGEFLARQWRFARELTPTWFRVLAPFALVAGLVDRRTRIPVAITLGLAAAMTFGLRQGAWVHRLWNFPWVAPITIGTIALGDIVRRRLGGRRAAVAGGVGALVVAVTFAGMFDGRLHDTQLRTPAKAGAILEQVSAPEGIMWVTPGIPAPRWVSYYLDVPVWTIEERYADLVGPGDLVLTRTDRKRDWITLPDESLLQDGHYRLLDGASLSRPDRE